MKNLLEQASISKKIFSVVVLLLVLMLSVGAIGLWTLQQYSTRTAAMQNASARAFIGQQINGLVYSVVADSRGIYMASTTEEAKKYATPLLAALASIHQKIGEQKNLLPATRAHELDELSSSIDSFITFRAELVRESQEVGLEQARTYGDNEANRSNRKKLNEVILSTSAANADEVTKSLAEVAHIQLYAKRAIILVSLVGMLIGAGMTYRIVRFGILKPLNSIWGAMVTLAKGDMTVDVPGIHRGDELGSMAGAVQIFKESGIEKNRLDEVQKQEQQAKEVRRLKVDALLEKFNERSTEVVSYVASAATELSATAEHMSMSARTTNEHSASATDSSLVASQNVQSVAAAAEEMASTVSEIASQVSRSTTVAREAMDKVSIADSSSNELLRVSNSINEITVMIENIASQINLLALNATIESARAGEAGRGFAVVASEVKNLANQATKATEQIREQLNSVQTLSGKVASELGGVKQAVERVEEYSSAIAAAVEEQSAATNEIVNSMNQAASGVQSFTGNMKNISRSAENTMESTLQVLDAAKMLSQQSEVLDSEVRTFLSNIKAA